MVTDTDKMEAVLSNPLVLITDRKINVIQDIMPVLEKVVQGGRELLIIVNSSSSLKMLKAKHWQPSL